MAGTPSRKDDPAVVALARKMAKAAGKCKADDMGRAAYMLLCCAAMTIDADAYVDWALAMEIRDAAAQQEGNQ